MPQKFTIRSIRRSEWPRSTQKVTIDQSVIEETVKNLRLIRCPVCTTKLESSDNFGHPMRAPLLTSGDGVAHAYCPKDNYVITLLSHQYEGNTYGTSLHMSIYANCYHRTLIADSGRLADIAEHVQVL
jgi:hypothetical protein